jgi:Holliday junction DNA helicase RuvA
VIGWLRGRLAARRVNRLVIDVGGVGYLLEVPPGTAEEAAVGDTLELHVHTHVREDQITLYGFASEAELETFHLLCSVKNIGPRLATTILGGISPADLAAAVESGQAARLKAVKGVGTKTAELICVELKGKLHPGLAAGRPLAAGATGPGKLWSDIRSALENLQYRPREVDAALADVQATEASEDFDVLLRACLKRLRR